MSKLKTPWLLLALFYSGSLLGICSDRCPKYGDEVKKITDLPHCVDNLPNPPPKDADVTIFSGPGHMGSRDVVGCAINLACFLKRNPTKMEFLKATGFLRASSTHFDIQKCLNFSESAQDIPGPVLVNNKSTSRALRCITGSGIQSAKEPFAWCSFDTIPSSDVIECADIPRIEPDNCARNPLALPLNSVCELIKTVDLPAVKPGAEKKHESDRIVGAIYNKLTAKAVNGDADSCVRCHTATRKEDGEQCYKFPFSISKARKGVVPLCPLRTIEPICPGGDLPVECKKGNVVLKFKPKCGFESADKPPQCAEGNAVCAAGGGEPICRIREPEVVAGSNRNEQPICFELRKIAKYLKTLNSKKTDLDPAFVEQLAQEMCTETFLRKEDVNAIREGKEPEFRAHQD